MSFDQNFVKLDEDLIAFMQHNLEDNAVGILVQIANCTNHKPLQGLAAYVVKNFVGGFSVDNAKRTSRETKLNTDVFRHFYTELISEPGTHMLDHHVGETDMHRLKLLSLYAQYLPGKPKNVIITKLTDEDKEKIVNKIPTEFQPLSNEQIISYSGPALDIAKYQHGIIKGYFGHNIKEILNEFTSNLDVTILETYVQRLKWFETALEHALCQEFDVSLGTFKNRDITYVFYVPALIGCGLAGGNLTDYNKVLYKIFLKLATFNVKFRVVTFYVDSDLHNCPDLVEKITKIYNCETG